MRLQKNKDKIILLGLMLFVGLSRILFASKLLYHWDSVQFALALDEWDLATHQPHPPGYIVYVFLGKLVYLFVKDANLSLVLVSIIAAVCSIPLLFYTTKKLAQSMTVAYATTLIFATLPVYWFHQELALSCNLEVFWVLLVVAVLIRGFAEKSKQPNYRSFLWLFSFLFGLSGGVRLQTFMMLIPLLVWVWWKHCSWFSRGISLAFTVMGILIWLVPLLYFSGGFGAYTKAFLPYSKMFNFMLLTERNQSLVQAISSLAWLVWQFLGLLTPFFVLGLKKVRGLPSEVQTVLFLWAVPGAAYYGIYFLAPQSLSPEKYLLAYFLPLLIIAVYGFISGIGNNVIRVVFLSSVVFFNFFTFVKADGSFSASVIENHDEIISERVSLIKKNFLPDKTLIVISRGYFYHGLRHSSYYLPEYKTLQLAKDLAFEYPSPTDYLVARGRALGFESRFFIPEKVQYLVLFGDMPIDLEQAVEQKIIKPEDILTIKNFGKLKKLDTNGGLPLFYIESENI